MSDKMDDVIRELAAKHGVLIGKDDPVLMLATLQAVMLRDLQENQSAALADFHSRLELMMSSLSADSKSRAERIVNGALDASKRAIDQQKAAFESALAEVFERKAGELRGLVGEIGAGQQAGIRTLYWISGTALAISLLALLFSALL
jgi:hypothetical protein